MCKETCKEKCSDDAAVEEQVIERMGHISSELAHDLRSPLQTIQNAIYLIRRDPENEQLYSMVKKSLTQATEILDSFRDYYKAHVLQMIEVDPAKVMDLAFSELEIPENIKVVKEVDEVQPVQLDPSKVALAIRKLLINSIEAMPEGGELNAKVSENSDYVTFKISDTGKGISPELAEMIYTPFLANNKKGKGLGVPTVKRIVESHGGDLDFTSEPEKGTVFTLRIPRSAVNL